MTYEILWHPKIRKYLSKLPNEVSARIIKKIRDIQENPFHYLKHFEGENLYKLCIGDYRALIDVEPVRKILFVRILDHRKRVYKK